MATPYTKIKRHMLAHFLNTGTVSEPVWSRINKGVTELTTSYNPEVTTEKYIGDENASNSIDSYAPNTPVSMTAFKDEPVFEFVDNIRKTRATGEECRTQLLSVNVYETEGTNAYYAEKQDVMIQVDSFGGETNVAIEYTMLYDGDPVQGTATITSGTVSFSSEE